MDCLQSPLHLIVVLGIVSGTVGACNRAPQEPARPQTDTLSEKSAAQIAATQSLLAQQRNRWQASSVSDYRFTLVRNVANSPSSANPIIVTVRNGTIASARYKSAPDIVKVDPKEQKQLPTIDSLFTFVEQSAQEGIDSLRVRYDAEAGFPYTIFIDRDTKKTNDEVEIEVKDFVPLPPEEHP